MPAAPAGTVTGRLDRDPRLLMASQTISTVGDALLMVAVPLMVLQVSGSAAQVGVAVALIRLPDFLGFLTRPVRDRMSARTIIALGGVLRCGLVGVVAVILASGKTDQADLPLIYTLLMVTNLVAAISLPVRSDFITSVVPSAQLLKFNSYDRTLEAMAVALGAGVAGVLFETLPIWLNFALGAVSFLGSTGIVAALGIRGAVVRQQRGIRARQPVGRAIGRLLAPLRNRLVALLLLGEFLTAFAFGVFLAVFVVYVRLTLEGNGAVYGAMELVQAAVASLTGVLLGRERIRLAERDLPVVGYLGMGLSVIMLGMGSSIPLAFVMVGLLGAANICYAVGVRTAFQRTAGEGGLIEVFAAEAALSRLGRILGASAGAAALALAAGSQNWLLAGTGVLMIGSAVLARIALAGRADGKAG